jgi:hypothetical protein
VLVLSDRGGGKKKDGGDDAMKRRQANKISKTMCRGVKLAWKPRMKSQAIHMILRSAVRAVRTWVLCGVPEEKKRDD